METNVLDSVDAGQLAAALQAARKRAEITQEAAAEVIGAARTTVVAIEKGQRRIKADELLKLARAYGRPLTDFVREQPQAEPFAVQFRRAQLRPRADYEEIEPVIKEFEDDCREYVELERIMGAPINRRYPAEYSLSGLPVERAAEIVAIDERHRLNLGDGPVAGLRDVLEQEVGLRVFFLDMPYPFSELYVYSDQQGGCLAINRKHTEERRGWSMARVYAHFLTSRYKPFIGQDRDYQRVPESERAADAFAMYFLMPTGGLVRRINDLGRVKESVTIGDLCTIARYYGVSLEATIRRLETLHLVGGGKIDIYKQDSIKAAEPKVQLRVSDAHMKDDRLPTRYLYLALDAYQQERIGEGQFARLMRVDRLEARQIAKDLLEPELPYIGDNNGSLYAAVCSEV